MGRKKACQITYTITRKSRAFYKILCQLDTFRKTAYTSLTIQTVGCNTRKKEQ